MFARILSQNPIDKSGRQTYRHRKSTVLRYRCEIIFPNPRVGSPPSQNRRHFYRSVNFFSAFRATEICPVFHSLKHFRDIEIRLASRIRLVYILVLILNRKRTFDITTHDLRNEDTIRSTFLCA